MTTPPMTETLFPADQATAAEAVAATWTWLKSAVYGLYR